MASPPARSTAAPAMKYAFDTIAVSVPDHQHGERQQAAAQAGTAPWRAAPTASITMPTMNPSGVR